MKRCALVLMLCVFVSVLFSPLHAGAQPICDWVSMFIDGTEARANDLFRERIQGDEFTVTGSVMEVKINKNSILNFFIASCGNQAFTTFVVKNTPLNCDFRIGQRVKFVGKCMSMKKGDLRSTSKRHVLFFF